MAARYGLNAEVKELKLGDTFNKSYKEGAYHTIRYDFKPASMDKKKMGAVEVENNHQVTVTVPHVDGAGTTQTVFKGNHKPVARECILIIDHNTGEIVLERISQTISVKTTRPEVASRRPTTPLEQITRRNSPPQKCSPMHMPSRGGSSLSHTRPSPSHPKNSPSKSSPHARSPLNKSPNPNLNAPGSMPLLGFEENAPNNQEEGVISESSSDSESNSSSSSSSDSDSDSEGDQQQQQEAAPKKANGHGNAGGGNAGGGNVTNSCQKNSLMDDLDLSEDSD